MLKACITLFFISTLGSLFCAQSNAQAALLMAEPYGFFGAINPTGHNAVYLARVCAETPVKLRRCNAGEYGSVIARYQGINGYDWVAIPLVPYLYSVENAWEAPAEVDRDTVKRLRNRYRETHLEELGEGLHPGNLVRGGWTQLVGSAYDRRIYAFRFETTAKQDDALIERMNGGPNRSHFQLLYSNCSDFARVILNFYYPGTFGRSIFPDAGVTTPRQIAYKLERYARKHPETGLTVLEISQVPGNRRLSRSNKSIAASLTPTAYAVPIALTNPYLAGGLFVDYLVRGRFHLIPREPQLLGPGNLFALTGDAATPQNPGSAAVQAHGTVPGISAFVQEDVGINSGLKEIKVTHE